MSHDINNHIARLKESFLLAAARGGRLQECASLLDLGAEIEWRENNDDTPLLAAVRGGHKDCCSLLLAHGANPAGTDRDGNTVMHLIAARNEEGMLSLFAPNAAALSCKTNASGMTAIDIAVQRGFSSFAEHLTDLICERGRAEADEEEKTEPLAGFSMDILSIDDDAASESDGDSDSDSGDHSNAISFSSPAEIQHTSTSMVIERHREDDEDDSISSFFFDTNLIDTPDRRSTNNSGISQDSQLQRGGSLGSSEAILGQLQHMTQLANSVSKELYQAKFALNELMQERDSLKNELAIISGDNESDLSHKTLPELNSLEVQAKRALERIIKAKEMASSNLEDERVCVICKENSKNVLLMPCRHMCVCGSCGFLDVLVQCPLCREPITERIKVFA